MHWLVKFENLIQNLHKWTDTQAQIADCSDYISHIIHKIITECLSYEEAIKLPKATYLKLMNELFTSHLLATQRQQNDKTWEHYL